MQNTVLITGANRGIGLELARRYAAGGARVIATARDPDTAGDLRGLPGAITIAALDVTDPAALDALAGETGPLDLVICNAGQYRGRGPISAEDNTLEAWQATLMTNVAGVFFTARAMLPNLKTGTTPKLAVISSLMGSSADAPGGSHLYRCSKAAATNLARNLAADLKSDGIAVGAYHPGWVRTDMGTSAAAISVEESAEGLMARFDALSLQSTGIFEDYQGKPIAF